MAPTVKNVIYSNNGKSYAGMTKESIRADIDAMSFKSEKEREKAYNKQTKIFDYANSLVKDEVDDFISEKEIEAYNKKEKTKKILKTAGLIALGIGVAVGGKILAKKLTAEPLCDGEKYIKKYCRVFKKDEYTVIKGKWGVPVDLSRIGELKEGTIVKYNTPKQAKRAAKDFVMKQFELPFEMQKEVGVTVEGRTVLGISIGNNDRVRFKGLKRAFIFRKRTIDFYHNHPFDITNPVDFPLSDSDITSLVRSNLKSITAFNHLGEYSHAEIINPIGSYCSRFGVDDALESYMAKKLLGNAKGRIYDYLRNMCRKITPDEISELGNLKDELYYKFYEDLLKQHPQKYVELLHETYQKVLPKFGIKYTTNYSNLTKI